MSIELLKTIEAMKTAQIHKKVFDNLTQLRKQDRRTFANALLEIGKKSIESYKHLANELRLTNEEKAVITLTAYQRGLIDAKTFEENIVDFGFGDQLETLIVIKPDGRQLFIEALKVLRKQNISWTRVKFIDFSRKCIDEIFDKSPQPFTKQDVKTGLEWYLMTRKKIHDERKEKEPRYDANTQVTKKYWREFFKLRFESEMPVFADDFIKAVKNLERGNGKKLNMQK